MSVSTQESGREWESSSTAVPLGTQLLDERGDLTQRSHMVGL